MLLCVVAGILSLLCITQPFTLQAQLVFVIMLMGMAFILRAVPGRYPMLMMMVLSLTISCRYIWWRYTSTLDWFDPVSLTCGLLLLAAETYAWIVLLLGYWQTAWPLNRPPAPLPAAPGGCARAAPLSRPRAVAASSHSRRESAAGMFI